MDASFPYRSHTILWHLHHPGFPAKNFFTELYLRNLLTSRMLTVMILILRNTLSGLVLPTKIYDKQSLVVFNWIVNSYFCYHNSSWPIWSFGYPIALLTILTSLRALSSPFGSLIGSMSLMIDFSSFKKSPQALPVSSENSTKKTIVAIQAVLGLVPNHPVFRYANMHLTLHLFIIYLSTMHVSVWHLNKMPFKKIYKIIVIRMGCHRRIKTNVNLK